MTFYEIVKIKIAKITCIYFGDKSQKFAPTEKTSYTVILWHKNIMSSINISKLIYRTRCNYNRGDYKVSQTKRGTQWVGLNLGHFLFQRGWDHSVWTWPTYHQMLPDTRNQNINGLGVGISTDIEILGHFWFKGGRDHPERSWPTYHQMLPDTRNQNIYGLGVGISTVFELLGHFRFKGGRDHPVRSWPTYHQMLPDTRNKSIYGLGVGISTVFEILGHFRFKGGRDHPVRSWPTYHQMLPDTRNKNIYSLGMEISTVFEIFSNFAFQGGGVDPRGHIECMAYIACERSVHASEDLMSISLTVSKL